MLSKGDDYPIHQTPDPVAYAGTHPNFYDRYWFNGYSRDGEIFFAMALGVYPFRNVMDASFSVIHDGMQHNIHASRNLQVERMDTRVGPIGVEVIEPLQTLRVWVEENEYDIHGEVIFQGRAKAFEEPRFTLREGTRLLWDYTRLTQSGTYAGRLQVKGQEIEVSRQRFFGTRDRSWGIRPIGDLTPQPMANPPQPQYYWLWAPLNFEDCVTFFGVNENANGTPWHRSGRIMPLGDGEPLVETCPQATVVFKSGTRHVRSAVLEYPLQDGRSISIALEPQYQFYMAGLGYMHPQWQHATYKGENVTGYEAYDLRTIDETLPIHLHVQSFCTARMTDQEGKLKEGAGVLEQTVLGPHAPSGFRDLFDPAP
jgi:hypothetical protein